MSYNSNYGDKTKTKSKKGKGKMAAPGASRRGEQGAVFWGEVNPDTLIAVLEAVVSCGGAVMFSRAADCGALGVRVYHDDHEIKTVWGRPDDDLSAKLQQIASYYADYYKNKEVE